MGERAAPGVREREDCATHSGVTRRDEHFPLIKSRAKEDSAVAYAWDQRGVELTHKLSAVHVVVKSRGKSECWGS
jgi:hypothetical protein